MTDPSAAAGARPWFLPAAVAVALQTAVLGFVRSCAFPACAVALLAFLPYANAIGAEFVFDDWVQIWAHPALRGPLDWLAVLAAPLFPGDLYRPLTIATFALDAWLFGHTAWWFHLVNVGLHVLVSLLVAYSAQQLFRSARVAFLAGALFAVHPIHTEAVTGVVGRHELLAALLGLTATLAASEAARATRRRRLWLAVSVGAFFLALFAKENSVLWLPLMLLYRASFHCGTWRQALWAEARRLDWLAWLACIAAYLYLRFLVVGPLAPGLGVDFADNVLAHVPWTERVATALAILAEYASQFAVPLVLSADYSYPQVPPVQTLLEGRLWLGIALVAASLFTFWRRPGAVGFAALFPLLGLALTGNLLFPIGTVRAERLLYLPSIGLCWLLALAVEHLFRTRARTYAALFSTALLLAYAVRTWQRNFDWQTQAALFAATARDAPFSSKAHKNHAVELQRAGQHELARQAYLRSWTLYPREEGTAFGLGTAYEHLGAFEQALAWYERALDIEPRHRGAHQNRCRLLIGLARWREAEQACRAGLRIAPAEPNLWKGIALAWEQLGEKEKARAAFRIASALDPGDPALHAAAQAEPEPGPHGGVQP